MIARILFLLCFLGSWASAEYNYKPTYWTIKVQESEDIPLAKVAMTGGVTLPGVLGVHYQLPNLKSNQYVTMYLVSKSKAPLEFIAFKGKPSQPLLELSTDGDGVVEANFRANGTVYFRISGEGEPEYQLLTVVSPEVDAMPEQQMVSMKEFTSSSVGEEKAPLSMESSESSSDPTGGKDEASNPLPVPTTVPAPVVSAANQGTSWTTVAILVVLSLILVVLVVIAFLMLKGKRVAILLIPLVIGVGSGHAQLNDRTKKILTPRYLGGTPEHQKRIGPHLVDRSGMADRMEERFRREKAGWSGASKGHSNNAKIIANAIKALNLAKKAGFLDPKDAAVQPNYTPRGIPSLPSSYLDDRLPSGEATTKFHAIQDKIEKGRRHLEGNYVVLKETELKVGIIHEMADAAAGLSPYAQLAWTTMKANPNEGFNKSAATFYKKYDLGQENGLKYLDDALKEMGEFEGKYYDNPNWYLMFGLPLYQFLSTRYVRPER